MWSLIPLSVLDGMKLCPFQVFFLSSERRQCQSWPNVVNGGGVLISEIPFCERNKQRTWNVQVHCTATDCSSCVHESVICLLKFLATNVLSLLIKTEYIWFTFVEQILCE